MIDASERNYYFSGCYFFLLFGGRVGVLGCTGVVKHRRNNDLSSATSCIQIVLQYVERRSLHHALALDLRL